MNTDFLMLFLRQYWGYGKNITIQRGLKVINFLLFVSACISFKSNNFHLSNFGKCWQKQSWPLSSKSLYFLRGIQIDPTESTAETGLNSKMRSICFPGWRYGEPQKWLNSTAGWSYQEQVSFHIMDLPPWIASSP